MTDDRPHVVIVGGGFGGLAAARALRKSAGAGDARRPPQPPSLPAAALPGRDRGALTRRHRVPDPRDPATSSERQRAARGGRVDRRPGVARSSRRTAALRYDYLVLATGARHAYFGHDEWEPLAPGLKSLEDALEIRRRILLAFERAERETDPDARRALLTFVIVGGGPTGVELAGAIAEIAREAIEARTSAPSTRPRRASCWSRRARACWRRFPSRCRRARPPRPCNERARRGPHRTRRVTAIDPGSVALGSERVARATVLWAAGVAASPLVASLGAPIDRAGRVRWSRTARSPDIPRSS